MSIYIYGQSVRSALFVEIASSNWPSTIKLSIFLLNINTMIYSNSYRIVGFTHAYWNKSQKLLNSKAYRFLIIWTKNIYLNNAARN